ncbi:MAG: class II aldolase/adducin family protein [Acinetobacter amyesii]|uniref:class II aldolase/adducin family protein n=1 Tax=Acinetobacter amyesii TaxID=2942470 RepID=UPI003D003E30
MSQINYDDQILAAHQDIQRAIELFVNTGNYPLRVGNAAVRVEGTTDQFIIGSFYSPLSGDKVTQPVVVDFDGNIIQGEFNYSFLEVAPLYIAIFKERPDVKAAVHTHSTFLTAHSVAHQPLVSSHISLPRFGVIFDIPVAEWSPRFDSSSISDLLKKRKDVPAILHANHGPLVFGKSIYDAAKKAIFFEEGAKIQIYANLLGGAKSLPAGAYEDIQAGLSAELIASFKAKNKVSFH